MICKQTVLLLLVMFPKWRIFMNLPVSVSQNVLLAFKNHYMFPSSPFSRTLTWTEAANFSQVAALTKLW